MEKHFADLPDGHPLYAKVKAALETIRGYLQADGGDIRVLKITHEYALELELMGACSACNISAMTMQAGVEQAVRKAVPEITRVYAINA